nr:PD-(D/E)XK nuclease family protein [candidate division Zixibacteria bacterium]
MARSYSNSRIETFQTCPRQYKFQYIEKAAVEKPVGVEAFLGNAVHHALEKLYSLKLNGKLLTVNELLGIYHEHWDGPDRDRIKVTRENLGVDDYIRVGEEALKRYYDKYHPFDDGDVLALEKSISFPLDPESRFMINAKVDRISRRADGVVEIVDYKTKAFLPTQHVLEDDAQMGLYQMGVSYLWPDFDRFELKQIFLRQGVEMKAVMDKDKLDEIRYRTYQKILEIERAVKFDDFPPQESAICDWCIYFELCPAKRHRLALDEEIEVEFDPGIGSRMAGEYLSLNEKKKQIETEMKALKTDIVKYCEDFDVSSLEGDQGLVRVSFKDEEMFPSKTASEDDYLEISYLARRFNLEECFKLDQNVLYKEFYITEKLPPELKKQLEKFLIKRRRETLYTRYKGE